MSFFGTIYTYNFVRLQKIIMDRKIDKDYEINQIK